ncbi:MAG: Crp/Fnr family transcriptional regulator [Bacteroidales bacterium]
MKKILENTPLFRGVSAEDIEEIINSTTHHITLFSKGDIIALRGSQVNSFTIILNGKVRAEIVDDGGRVIKIDSLEEGDYLAPAFIFADQNRFPVDVTASVDCEILYISRESFVELLQSHQQILTNFLRIISNRSQFLSQKIMFLTFRTIKSKLAFFLRERTADFKEKTITLSETQQELADYFGVSRPALARAIGELSEDGCIEAFNRRITILKADHLRRYAGGDE